MIRKFFKALKKAILTAIRNRKYVDWNKRGFREPIGNPGPYWLRSRPLRRPNIKDGFCTFHSVRKSSSLQLALRFFDKMRYGAGAAHTKTPGNPEQGSPVFLFCMMVVLASPITASGSFAMLMAPRRDETFRKKHTHWKAANAKTMKTNRLIKNQAKKKKKNIRPKKSKNESKKANYNIRHRAPPPVISVQSTQAYEDQK